MPTFRATETSPVRTVTELMSHSLDIKNITVKSKSCIKNICLHYGGNVMWGVPDTIILKDRLKKISAKIYQKWSYTVYFDYLYLGNDGPKEQLYRYFPDDSMIFKSLFITIKIQNGHQMIIFYFIRHLIQLCLVSIASIKICVGDEVSVRLGVIVGVKVAYLWGEAYGPASVVTERDDRHHLRPCSRDRFWRKSGSPSRLQILPYKVNVSESGDDRTEQILNHAPYQGPHNQTKHKIRPIETRVRYCSIHEEFSCSERSEKYTTQTLIINNEKLKNDTMYRQCFSVIRAIAETSGRSYAWRTPASVRYPCTNDIYINLKSRGEYNSDIFVGQNITWVTEIRSFPSHPVLTYRDYKGKEIKNYTKVLFSFCLIFNIVILRDVCTHFHITMHLPIYIQ
ncbi:unnamed protein product, partial [Meganyctiphanes norvegica]